MMTRVEQWMSRDPISIDLGASALEGIVTETARRAEVR
jgi:hypothetical protein